MIPIALTLKNFLSYGAQPQTIDFGSYPLICLSGKNGHGKSALLDAITWALWGQARKLSATSRPDQGLLRLGQTHMLVNLEFECNGVRYRIKREFSISLGKAQAVLEFGLYDTDQQRYIPLTDKTLRDTQAKIDSMLHLDFDAFVNSAFLRQGHSNEFSKKTPKERKEVLAAILGISQYETVRKLAADKAKEAQATKAQVLTMQAKYQSELERLPIVTTRLTHLNEEMVNNKTHQHELRFKYQVLEEEKKQLDQLRKEQELLHFKKTQHENQQAQGLYELRKLVATWREIHRRSLVLLDKTQLAARKHEMSTRLKQLHEQRAQQLELKERVLHLKEQCQKIEYEIKQDHTTQLARTSIELERFCVELDHTNSTIGELTIQIDQSNQALLELAREQTTTAAGTTLETPNREEIERYFEKRKEHYQQWIAQANMLKAELESLHQKQAMVCNDAAPSCPLCEQNLSLSRRRFLKKKFDDHELFIKRRLVRLSTLLKKLKPLLIEQHAHLEQLKSAQHLQALAQQEHQHREQQREHINQRLQVLQSQRATCVLQAEKQQQKLNSAQANHQLLSSQTQSLFVHHQEYRTLYQQWQEAVQRSTACAFQQTAYDRLLEELRVVQQQEEQEDQLRCELNVQPERSRQIAQWCATLKTIKGHYVSLDQEIKHTEQSLERQTLWQIEHETLLKQLSDLTQALQTIVHEQGALEHEVRSLTQRQAEIATQQTHLEQLDRAIDDYQAIATATSKDGIQALLIEDAIPEIEQEANSLLSKLTDNQTQLFIESLRDLKKGGTKETLDIKISDAAGIRPYELFSGGEAFRIDFALRIAISKLLARRAGTSLQTLIIDEGFGSQDEEGLGHIMEAIYKIQEDFAKVIIVSHLPSMKDQFPVHFFIEKGPQGSTVNIIEQG